MTKRKVVAATARAQHVAAESREARLREALVYISRWLDAERPTDDRDVRAIVGIARAALTDVGAGADVRIPLRESDKWCARCHHSAKLHTPVCYGVEVTDMESQSSRPCSCARLVTDVGARAQVFRRDDGWWFRIKGANGEVLATGEAYKAKRDAVAAAKALVPAGVEIEVGS